MRTDLKIIVSGEDVWQVDHLMSSPLGRHNNAPDLLHLRVVWGTDTKQVTGNLQKNSTNVCKQLL